MLEIPCQIIYCNNGLFLELKKPSLGSLWAESYVYLENFKGTFSHHFVVRWQNLWLENHTPQFRDWGVWFGGKHSGNLYENHSIYITNSKQATSSKCVCYFNLGFTTHTCIGDMMPLLLLIVQGGLVWVSLAWSLLQWNCLYLCIVSMYVCICICVWWYVANMHPDKIGTPWEWASSNIHCIAGGANTLCREVCVWGWGGGWLFGRW